MKWAGFIVLALALVMIFLATREEQVDRKPADDEELTYVYAFDVGQGDSTLIKTPDETILIDAGNNGKGDDVVRYLKELEIEELTALVATHPDADHIGGLDDVLSAFEVKSVYAPRVSHTTETFRDFLLAVKKEGVTIKPVRDGTVIPSESAELRFLAPIGEGTSDLNSWSAVLRLETGERSFLFMGDAPFRTESLLIDRGVELQADVLKVGHHGADTSTSLEFLASVAPERALISAGEGNAYDHPRASVLRLLKQAGVEIDRTDRSGTIRYATNGETLEWTAIPEMRPE
ncbi:ComEC/Rec2 family competence protein [Exiguobacterium flavidum]|uniref:ComEC/Rec2 family competence protein n=1 Tax=Exiguobacterium flavidum TaxID=2184695 RepID=UPI000DF76A1B|nr:ComEC/Rec2 family competence protein [Exiguobacterium flavidum]